MISSSPIEYCLVIAKWTHINRGLPIVTEIYFVFKEFLPGIRVPLGFTLV